MTRAAERLLAALAQPGAYAFADPLDGAALIVRSGREGISLGGGRFPVAAGEQLLAQDLVRPELENRRHLVLGPAGRARLRREAAPEGSAFLAQHLDLVPEEEPAGANAAAPAAPRLRDASESPVAWMARRRGSDGRPLLEPAAFEAGERLRRDITVARMTPRLGVNWGAERVDGSGPRDPAAASDAVVAARQRVRGALDAVGGDLANLLIDLCGELKGLERIEAERRWPARSAKVVARIALGRLAEHYGLERAATGPDRARMRLWRESA
ncbi:ATPase [Methylobacterium radiodurans]|uniref:ATPase n=1 Tax=Methylobacterium radiodurans TaxID=2202828 RepID=A0A2U8W078_9HYPH|nr:ATPase [Methylobacterium radiodurans]